MDAYRNQVLECLVNQMRPNEPRTEEWQVCGIWTQTQGCPDHMFLWHPDTQTVYDKMPNTPVRRGALAPAVGGGLPDNVQVPSEDGSYPHTSCMCVDGPAPNACQQQGIASAVEQN